MQPHDVTDGVTLSSFRLRGSRTTDDWVSCSEATYGNPRHWTCQAVGSQWALPFDIEITSSTGVVLQSNDVINEWGPKGEFYDFGKNFDASSIISSDMNNDDDDDNNDSRMIMYLTLVIIGLAIIICSALGCVYCCKRKNKRNVEQQKGKQNEEDMVSAIEIASPIATLPGANTDAMSPTGIRNSRMPTIGETAPVVISTDDDNGSGVNNNSNNNNNNNGRDIKLEESITIGYSQVAKDLKTMHINANAGTNVTSGINTIAVDGDAVMTPTVQSCLTRDEEQMTPITAIRTTDTAENTILDTYELRMAGIQPLDESDDE